MMQSQILQSPARLGLTNPNSPSLSNPTTPKLTPQNPHHQRQQPLTTTLTTSSTLLSLLPPLPRAQSLLLQMALLAAKLFEVSPNRSLWLASFRGSLPTFLSSQILTLNATSLDSSSSSSAKEILSLFTSLQTQLFEAVAELQEILDLQDAKQKIARDIRTKDSALLAFTKKIKEAEHVLDVLVDDYSDYRHSKRLKSESTTSMGDSTSNASIGTMHSLSDVLSYAHRISYTTFAPPEFGAGQGPLRGALPPAPQEEQMRASQLYAFTDLDVGLPKAVETEERSIDALVEPSAMHPSEGIDLAAIKGLIPPQFTVPSGWQPGMPVELPSGLPLPPPGWKPGDPIPLPPMGALRAEEQQPRPVSQMPPRAPEPIQVQFVQLDINPDQDEYSSEYSSELGSSEEDDED